MFDRLFMNSRFFPHLGGHQTFKFIRVEARRYRWRMFVVVCFVFCPQTFNSNLEVGGPGHTTRTIPLKQRNLSACFSKTKSGEVGEVGHPMYYHTPFDTRGRIPHAVETLHRPALHVAASWILGCAIQFWVGDEDLKKDSDTQCEMLANYRSYGVGDPLVAWAS